MKTAIKKELLRLSTLVIASIFITSILMDYVGQYYFLIWVMPFFIIGMYLFYMKKVLSIDKEETRESNHSLNNNRLQRKIFHLRIGLSFLGILIISGLGLYICHIKSVYIFILGVIYIAVVNVAFSCDAVQNLIASRGDEK